MKSTLLFDQAAENEKKGIGTAIVTVIGKKGIAPRRSSRMIVYEDGTFSGTVGGGEAERNAIKDAVSAIKSGISMRKTYAVHHEGEIDLMIDVVSRKKRALIFGSGHVAESLKEVFHFLNFSVDIVDKFYGDNKKNFTSLDADENTAIIFTDHVNRDEFLEEAKKSKAFYIGTLGSRLRKTADDRVSTPSGLDIGSDSPEETAISIASEVMAALNNKSMQRLKDIKRRFVIVRGAGDLATAVIIRLKKAGYMVLALEIEKPSVIRRTVSFAEAIYDKETTVEGEKAVLISSYSEIFSSFDDGLIPILIDPEGKAIKDLEPNIVVDAIIAKKNLGTKINDAPLTIALGPGFEAGVDADIVIETKRGHNLGRIIKEGRAEENTGVPGIIEGYGKERVIHAPSEGEIRNIRAIGDIVEKGDVIAIIGKTEVKATISGMLRGLIKDGYYCPKGLKIADIDPRGERAEYLSISDKARCIAGSVLEAVDSFICCPRTMI